MYVRIVFGSYCYCWSFYQVKVWLWYGNYCTNTSTSFLFVLYMINTISSCLFPDVSSSCSAHGVAGGVFIYKSFILHGVDDNIVGSEFKWPTLIHDSALKRLKLPYFTYKMGSSQGTYCIVEHLSPRMVSLICRFPSWKHLFNRVMFLILTKVLWLGL